VKIYDFAMNLVVTLADGKDVSAGVWYDEFWDGRNEKGDMVANGVYFFKVQSSGDQTEWGKLVILK
jgi:flagellar hook assembly protein FlgD